MESDLTGAPADSDDAAKPADAANDIAIEPNKPTVDAVRLWLRLVKTT
jgi:hypothetical protein